MVLDSRMEKDDSMPERMFKVFYKGSGGYLSRGLESGKEGGKEPDDYYPKKGLRLLVLEKEVAASATGFLVGGGEGEKARVRGGLGQFCPSEGRSCFFLEGEKKRFRPVSVRKKRGAAVHLILSGKTRNRKKALHSSLFDREGKGRQSNVAQLSDKKRKKGTAPALDVRPSMV